MFVARIKAFAATVPQGTWITGGDWDHTLWGGELPRRDWIDAVTPDHPVWINRLDGHMALANTAALRAAGVDDGVKDVAGGEIVRDATGRPTGVLKDNAMGLVEAKMPPASDVMNDRALDAAMTYVAAQGVTAVHHMGTWDELAVFERAWRAHRLSTRIQAAVPLSTWERLRDTLAARRFGADGRGDAWLKVRHAEGVRGRLSRVAYGRVPRTVHWTRRRTVALFVTQPGDLYAAISRADTADLHVADTRSATAPTRRSSTFSNASSARTARRIAASGSSTRSDLRPADIPRFKAWASSPAVQPYHAIDDGRWAGKVIGPVRSRTTYAFRSLLDAGATLAFGSDWYVAPPTPLEGIYAAVTRRTLDDRNPGGWVPEQKISVEEALTAYTRGGAYASFSEGDTGAIMPGMLADITVIDRDLRTIPAPEIRGAKSCGRSSAAARCSK